jgi:Protein kinase domain/Ankyrin repeats (3 copies)
VIRKRSSVYGNNLTTPVDKKSNRRGSCKESLNSKLLIAKAKDIVTGEIVNLSDFETIKKRGEYMKIEGIKRRISAEDFNRRVDIDSWKLLTLITDQNSSYQALDFLSDGIAYVPDLDMTFESNRNFLIYAVLKAEPQLILKLLELKPDLIDKPDCYGRAAIHYAVLLSKFKVLTILVERKADFMIRDINGQSPLHLAAQQSNREIYLYLKFKGALGLEEDHFGLRPIDYIEDEEEYQMIDAIEFGSPARHSFRKSTQLILQGSSSFEVIDPDIKVKSTFSNPGKYDFNLRRRYFLRLGLLEHTRQVDSILDGYIERYEKSMLEVSSVDDEDGTEQSLPLEAKPAELDDNPKHELSPIISVRICSPISVPASATKDKRNFGEMADFSSSYMSFKAKQKISRVAVKDVQVQGMIGKGNFGKIYAVTVKHGKDYFAMKAYGKKEFLMTNLARFLFVEKRVMANFEHPFIVKMHYAFQNNDKLFILMDYCEKGDLGSQVLRLTNLQLKIMTCELVLAIKAMHDQEIIHRDIKPNNIFISHDGHIKLGDFGLAKENIKKGSLHYTFCGSIAYLPPEVINREGHNKTIDWYLMGELLYEMVSGAPPYYGQSKEELYNNIRNKELDMTDLHISDSLKDLIAGLIHRDISKRLGARYGAFEIMSHKYFVGIDWQKVYDKQYMLFDACSLPSYRISKALSDDAFKVSSDDLLHLPHWSFVR